MHQNEKILSIAVQIKPLSNSTGLICSCYYFPQFPPICAHDQPTSPTTHMPPQLLSTATSDVSDAELEPLDTSERSSRKSSMSVSWQKIITTKVADPRKGQKGLTKSSELIQSDPKRSNTSFPNFNKFKSTYLRKFSRNIPVLRTSVHPENRVNESRIWE